MTEPKDYKIAAVDRALALLEALADRPDQGVTSLAKSLGMTKSLVFRLLHTLEERGFVSRDPERAEFALGYRIGVLGERLGKDGALLYAARPVMDALRDRTSENVNLVVREGLKTYVLATRAGRHSIRLLPRPGATVRCMRAADRCSCWPTRIPRSSTRRSPSRSKPSRPTRSPTG